MREEVTVHLGRLAPKVHSVVYQGQYVKDGRPEPVNVSVYVPRVILKELSPQEDEPLALSVTFRLEQ